MTAQQRPVVVGVDGTPTSIAATAWGHDEARSRGVPLHLITTYPGMQTCASVSVWNQMLPSESEALLTAAERLLIEAVARLRTPDRGRRDVQIDTYAIDGDPRVVFRAQAHDASTVVLGSRRHGAFHTAVLGSLATGLTATAPCPVVVLRWSADLTVTEPAVVVGVQPDENGEDAIAYAFDYASRHGLPLHAVLCWWPSSLRLALHGQLDVAAGAQAQLSEAIAGWREKYPDVTVHEQAVLDHSIDGLLRASKGQSLLVVGRRARRRDPGLMLGSVSQGVLRHAMCPVAVID